MYIAGYFYFFFLQEDGANASSRGNISNLPSSIAKESTHLLKQLYAEKLEAGPTAANPGPMLLKQAATAEKLVSMSNGSKLMARKMTKKQIIYSVK